MTSIVVIALLPSKSHANCLMRLTHNSEKLWDTAAAAAAKSLQSCLTLCDPIDGSSSSSSVPGILQARILEWVADTRRCNSCLRKATLHETTNNTLSL